jgi:4-amino-4-deoxy-L-arabinose transferase-like glycosyltransferase
VSRIGKYRFDLLFVLLILALGLLGIFFRFGNTPPASLPWSDESEIAADAVASLKEGVQFHYPDQLAGGPAAVWLETAWMAVFGRRLAGLRILNGLVNLGSVLLLYLLVRVVPFDQPVNWPFSGPSFDQWLGLTSSLFMAGSTWLLGLARIAAPNWSLVPPLASLMFVFLWLGLKTNRWWYFVLTGLAMGWTAYNYIPALFLPIVPAIFLVTLWLNKEQRLLQWPYRRCLVPYLVAFAVALPVIVFFALYPTAVMQRVFQLSQTNQISDFRLMAQGVVDAFSSFGILPNWILQGKFENVAFDPFLVVLFVAGLVITLRRWRDPAYLFFLIWWFVMIMPAFLSRSASLGFIFETWRRGIGAQPVAFVFPALTVITGAQWALERLQQNRFVAETNRLSAVKAVILPGLVAVTVTVSVGWSYWLYFERWANSGVISLFFADGPVRLVAWMETVGDAKTVFVFPKRANASPTVRPELFTIRYMYAGEAELAFPTVDEATLDQVMSDILATNQPAVVRLMQHDRITADPKHYFEYALGWRGERISDEKQPDFDVITYRLHDDFRFGPPEEFQAGDVDFGQSIKLVGQQIQPGMVSAGRTLAVALRWIKLAETKENVDYNVRVVLFDIDNNEVTGDDKPLLGAGDYQTTRHWQPGTETTAYYSLAVPADTPPGRYSLRAVAYDPDTGQRLLPGISQADLSYSLAEVKILPNFAPVEPSTLPVGRAVDRQLAEGLRLVGVDSTISPVQHPGDRVQVSLWWQATEALSQDFGLALELQGSDKDSGVVLDDPQPLISDYATADWPAGAVYRTRHTVVLPARLNRGQYALALRLLDLETGAVTGEQHLAQILIETRDRVYQASPLANQLNADFEDVIRLRGFEFGPEVMKLNPGGEITLKLQWQALREMSESYKIFLHLTDGSGQIVGQLDVLPKLGAAPTSSWVPGEIIEDELRLDVPALVTGGSYRLAIGLYNEHTGERLLSGQSDQLVLLENGRFR